MAAISETSSTEADGGRIDKTAGVEIGPGRGVETHTGNGDEIHKMR